MAKSTMKFCTVLIWVILATIQGVKMSGIDDKATAQQDVPAFHNAPPQGHEGDALDVKQFANDPKMRTVYGRADEARNVLYQLPCYCKCTRYLKHTSLLSCYREKHATTCDICQKEAIFAYEKAKKGESVAQIREEVVKGDWKDMNVDSYVSSQQDKK
jgi:hypothetical protein